MNKLTIIGNLFQFTPLREGRRRCLPDGCESAYFNSRPSARGDADTNSFVKEGAISIHAPPRGATGQKRAARTICAFQFTPLREGRRAWRTARALPRHFNSRPSARGDQSAKSSRRRAAYFNSRPSARGDMLSTVHIVYIFIFQFTPLREGRPRHSRRGHHGSPFQFTPLREGRLAVEISSIVSDKISIHAPPRGATPL